MPLQGKAMPLSLFILKENPAIRQDLSASVSESSDMVIVGEGAWDDDSLARLRKAQPDCLIFELHEKSAVTAQVASLRELCKRTRFLAITGGIGLDDTIAAIDAGVEGLLEKGCTVEEIRSALSRLEQDGTYLDSTAALQIIRHMDTTEARRRKAMALDLTALEEDVLRDLSDGKGNLEIADHLRVSERTVKACVGTLKKKFGVAERLDIVLSARNLALACVTKIKLWIVSAMPIWEEVLVII